MSATRNSLERRAAVLALALLGCSAYDASLLSAKVNLKATGGAGTGGTFGGGSGGSSSGSGGNSGGTSSSLYSRDGGLSDGAVSASTDGSTGGDVTLTGQTRCGDGMITGDEKCDISIADGMPGACPKDCPMLSACTPRGLNGNGCQAECVVLQVSCMGGDACCPGSCTHDTDSDCSGSCGNGTVDTAMGETCEPSSSTPCPTAADCDDKDPCTTDMLTGSAMNCNAACVHTPVTAVMSGDMCCPAGANANTDSDCTPKCGNGVREGSEECDGGMGCDTNCKLTFTAEQQMCLAMFSADECDRCSCLNCTSEYVACRATATASANDQCNGVLVCARKNNCTGTPCYCGTDTSPTCGWGIPGGPQGPCAREIEAAAGAGFGDVLTVNAKATDLTSPLGRAYAADKCRVANCASVCR